MEASTAENRIERGGFLVFLALATLAFLAIAWPFAAPILWAALAAIIFQPLYRRFLGWRPGHENQAAVATLLVVTFAVVLPAVMIGSAIVAQAIEVVIAFQEGRVDVAGWFAQIMGALPSTTQAWLAQSGWGDLVAAQNRIQDFAEQSAGLIAAQALAIGGGVAGFLLSLGVALYVGYFFLRDGSAIGHAVVRALPMERAIAEELADRFLTIVRATIKGSGVVGLVQGALGAITFWIVGMPSVLLLGLLMAFASLLPAVGPALIWVPVAIYLLAIGAVWQGVVVIASGVAVVGLADNLLRPILVGRDTGIPDWMILVTTLGGLALIGLSGIVLGPLAAGLFIAGWSILSKQREEASTNAPELAPGPAPETAE
ncbi:AI-2E family transporter [Erythrobacter sp. QSSC1-22B]|nr:AI-2E family transporter [Erythrobacter sp. QSSC1-22B]OBX19620.1 AI-2E family transporter [Erythrobacter sp. QSSC1-22B]